jgi:uncharacterized protein (TIGR00369 family)
MTLTHRLLAVSLTTLSFCFFLHAQQTVSPQAATVPKLMNFSGKATDAQGRPLSGIAGASFAIYKDQYDGSPLWLETQNVQADAKGNYTVQLGATKPDGLPLDLFSSGEARWLGVRVNGGQEQPRLLLLSVPYALKAADAQTIGGLPASAFVLAAPPSLSSGTTAPSNSSTAANRVLPNLAGSGTLDFVPLWTPDGNRERAKTNDVPVARLIGIEAKDIAAGRATVVLAAGPQHANPMGTLHGGILCDIADAAMGIAFASTLAQEESFTTIELKINFFRPAGRPGLRRKERPCSGAARSGMWSAQ